MQLLKERYKTIYESGVSSSYLVLESRDNHDKVKKYQVEMISRNQMESVLPLNIRYKDGTLSFYYTITSKLDLSQFLKRRKIKRNELIKILLGIGETLVDSKGYLLDEGSFIINEDFIFINPANFQLSLLYIPASIDKNIMQEFKDFIGRLILNIADIDEEESDNYLHKILLFVKSEIFNIKDFIDMLKDLMREDNLEHQLQKEEVNETNPACDAKEKGDLRKREQAKRGIRFSLSRFFKKTKDNKDVNEFISPVIPKPKDSKIGDTVFLGSPIEKDNYPYLYGEKDGEEELIAINKDDFLVGRLKGEVDYVLDNASVGKVHAQIITRENQYYIKDLNSMNGTYINNVKIEKNKEYKVANSDIISFANKDYIFVRQLDDFIKAQNL